MTDHPQAFIDMSNGALYDAGHSDLVAMNTQAQRLSHAYNATTRGDPTRPDILAQLLGGYGSRVVIRPPFYVDYGANIFLGDGVFLNYGCVLLDVCPIRIAEGTQIGPMVQLLAADHPRDPETRATGLENGNPITIGKNVWIGGGALVMPGIFIGDDAIIGAGAVVTRDVETGQTVAGNPARPLRARPA